MNHYTAKRLRAAVRDHGEPDTTGVAPADITFVDFDVALSYAWRQCQVRTVRWRLYQVAGNVVRHAGAVILKVQQWFWGLCEEIRTRCAEAAQT